LIWSIWNSFDLKWKEVAMAGMIVGGQKSSMEFLRAEANLEANLEF
jgi:hypothetical protein